MPAYVPIQERWKLGLPCDLPVGSLASPSNGETIAGTEPAVVEHAVDGATYHGRLLADVSLANGRDFAEFMPRAGSARPYGDSARQPWCRD